MENFRDKIQTLRDDTIKRLKNHYTEVKSDFILYYPDIQEKMDIITAQKMIPYNDDINYVNTLLSKLDDLYGQNGYVFHYFFFCNAQSPYYKLFNNNVDVDPDMFDIGTGLSRGGKVYPDTYEEYLLMNRRNILNDNESFKNNENTRYVEKENIFNVLGWRKQKLFDILLINGIFDFTTNNGKYIMTNLKKLGDPYYYQREYIISRGLKIGINGIKYPIGLSVISKMILEKIYMNVFKYEIDLDKICRSDLTDAASIRTAAEKLYNIQFNNDDDKQYVCSKIESIKRNMELSEDIGELSSQFMSQPGGVQYLKYSDQPKMFFKTEEEYVDRTQANISGSFQDISDLCHDNTKTNIDAYNMALDYGLTNYVTKYMTKNEICIILYN